jgi:hypothetical protein
MSALSRRSIVASAAALPALAVPAVVSAAVEPDPIFAAIAVHRKALAAWSGTLKASDGVNGPPDARIYLRDMAVRDYSMEDDDDGGFTVRWRPTGKVEPIYARSEADIRRNAPPNLSKEKRPAWVAEKITELRSEKQRLNDEFDKTSEGKLWATCNNAASEEDEAQYVLFDTTATTLQGLLALIAYIRSSDYLSEQLSGQSPLCPDNDQNSSAQRNVVMANMRHAPNGGDIGRWASESRG